MTQFLDTINNDFLPISLEEMSSVSLLDRTDTKFIFNIEKLNDVLDLAKEGYRVLEINNLRYSNYKTSYFDTQDFKFYYDHHNHHANRYKIRMRSYVDSDLHFFEIKYKSNQGRTVKSRVQIPNQENTIEGNAENLLNNVTGISSDTLVKTIEIDCKRATLVNNEQTERVTIDFDLNYLIDGKWHLFPEVAIIEVKQNKFGKSSFLEIMRKEHIRPSSMSKYSFGVANFINGIKNNNFKTQISYVNKICRQHSV